MTKLKSVASSQEGKRKDSKNKKKRKKVDKKKQKKNELWKKKAPGPNDSKTKELHNKTYHWCEHNMSLTVHNPANCCLNPSHPEFLPPRPRSIQATVAQPQEMPNAQTHQVSAKEAMINFLDQLQAILEEP